MTSKVEAVRDATGMMAIGGGAAISVEKATTMQILSENAVAIGALCTMVTCLVFVVTGIWGLVLKHKSTESYIQKRIKKALEDE